jgi:hypothetical protein
MPPVVKMARGIADFTQGAPLHADDPRQRILSIAARLQGSARAAAS